MSENRRREARFPLSQQEAQTSFAFANKYIDGMPYTVELLDASTDGIGLRRISEPDRYNVDDDSASENPSLALELCFEDPTSGELIRFWAWARRVRRSGDREAYQILAADPLDRARLRKFLRTLAA